MPGELDLLALLQLEGGDEECFRTGSLDCGSRGADREVLECESPNVLMGICIVQRTQRAVFCSQQHEFGRQERMFCESWCGDTRHNGCRIRFGYFRGEDQQSMDHVSCDFSRLFRAIQGHGLDASPV